MTVPRASLKVCAHMSNPPAPIGFDVIVDKRTVAVLTWADVDAAHGQFAALKKLFDERTP